MDDRTPKYFAFVEGEQRGPFTLRELTGAGIRPSTYVWCKGMDDWQRADSVAEITDYLKGHINTHPEPTPQYPNSSNPTNQTPDSQNPNQESQARRPPIFGRRFNIPEQEATTPDLSSPPQVSMVLAVISCLVFFPPSGIATIYYTHMALKRWKQAEDLESGRETPKDPSSPQFHNPHELKRHAKEYERFAKMWLGLTVCLGIILWTCIFSYI